MALRRRANDSMGGAIWPGFVDAMTAMLLVLTFVLSIFMITQYFLRETITGQETLIEQQGETIEERGKALETLTSRLDALSDMLSLVRTEKDKLAEDGTRLRASLTASEEGRMALDEELSTQRAASTALELDLEKRRAEAEETLTLLAAATAAEDALKSDVTRQQALLQVARAQLASVAESSEEDQRQVALLNEQTRELRAQLRALEERLSSTEAARDTATETAEERGEEIASLGTRLNAALAERNAALEENEALLQAQVDELEDFRSEFFGQVRRVLGDRDEIKIVGDRFVFQSEVLFAPASADLAEAGKAELGAFAAILNEIAADIPGDVNWILRIDGHTDRRPLRAGGRYRDNWELSQERALSVAQYLIRQHGVPPERLAPTGFGEYQPLDEGDSREALARNRRIELKLTER